MASHNSIGSALHSFSQQSGIGCASHSNTFLPDVIQHLPVGTLKSYERNVRSHSDRQIKKLAGTIRTVGFLVPIIVDGDNTIVAGHGRLAAALELGLRVVSAIRVDHLSQDQVKAFRIADNRLTELSTWGEKSLALELKDLAAVQLDPDILDLTGFEVAEIDLRLETLDQDGPDTDIADHGCSDLDGG